jgi:demethylmenaquinone methyltransferase / 2-methoxy-6-polyprenyl-1,4-benzoquinol methylase
MQDATYVQKAFSAIAPRYVAVNHVVSGGIDVLWRKLVAARVARVQPRRVLDVATGSGDLAAAIQKACPSAHVMGADFCAPMLAHAQARGLRDLVVADGLRLPCADASLDVITVGFGLRNMANYGAALREWARVLRPGGRLFILDFSLPQIPLVRVGYRFYLHWVLPTIAGLLTGEKSAYAYLGGSIETFPTGEAMQALVRENGFATCAWQPLTLGVAALYEATTPAPALGCPV